MEKLITELGINWKILIAQIANFAILLFVLKKFVYNPVIKLLEERGNKIAQGLTDAKMNAELASATKTDYEAAMAKARTEAHNIFQEGKKEAEAKKHEMVEAAKKDVEMMIASGKKTLEAEKNKMVEEAKKDIVSLAMEATKKILADQSKDISKI
jgi:F-type H+-transporting ATPase subunit b